MKKKYVSPAVTEYDIELNSMIATSGDNANRITINQEEQSTGHGVKLIDFNSSDQDDETDF